MRLHIPGGGVLNFEIRRFGGVEWEVNITLTLELGSGGNTSGIDYLVSVCAIFACHLL